jgi:chitosanase
MQLNAAQKRLLERVINVFETGSQEGDYSNISIYRDGPHNIRQITYGRSQTTEYGNLRRLVQDYANANGLFSQQLEPFADRVGSTPLTDNAEFKNLLRKAGREDPIMRRTQDRFFEEIYFRPAMKWADQNGFVQPLSALVIYDSFIHSGSILWAIRNKFPENPPSAGGDEKAWTRAYVNARHRWLATHSREVVRSTIYRTECFKREIQRENWDLTQVPVRANGTQVTA